MDERSLFEELLEEIVPIIRRCDVNISEIEPPTAVIEPESDLVEDIRKNGIQESLMLNEIGPNQYTIIRGIRRYRCACINGLTTVPAVITQVSDAQAAVLTLQGHTLRRENPLARTQALLTLLGNLSGKEIFQLSRLKPQTIKRCMRLMEADPRLREAMQAGYCSPTIAEAVAKLPANKQRAILDQWEHSKKKITGRDVEAAKQVLLREGLALLPASLFAPFDFPVTEVEVATASDERNNQWLHRHAQKMYSILLDLERSGALALKSNKETRTTCVKARTFLETLKAEDSAMDNVSKQAA
jgi:ParB/RepB/Spo0J family partition protein